MAKLSSLLNDRFLKREKTKTTALAERASSGSLTSFAGIFGTAKLTEKEQESLSELLKKYAQEGKNDIEQDLERLVALTSEVRAINNQAAQLHGERIKKAQEILKRYRDGAFTSWLISTYGNRQTPYNFLQYYEFFLQMPQILHPQIETMPRQAIYTLASREGSPEKKEEIVRNYKGQTKQELLHLIRSSFPLDEKDKRREDVGENLITALKRIKHLCESNKVKLTTAQKKVFIELLHELEEKI